MFCLSPRTSGRTVISSRDFCHCFCFFSHLSKITANFLGNSHGCERLNYENEAIPIQVLDFQSMTHELVISKRKVT